MDGEAGVESAPGAGSRFWFRVRAEPVAEDAAGAGGTAPSGLDDGLPSLHGHLLVVEDDPVNLEVIQAMVETLGLSCDGVGDGQQALQRVQHGGRYDLILMDLMMPGIDGLETTRRLHAWQQAQGRARSVVLAVTANAFESTRQQVLQAGMSGLVSKPIDFTTLGATLAQHLPAAASASMAAAPDQSVLTGDELCRRIDTLLPRLEGRRLDALARFGELRQAARGSRWAAALEAMRPDLETLAFDAVARRLRELRTAACPPAHAGDDSGAGATGGPAGPDPG